MCVNLRITLVQFITMSSSTRTVSKHQEIIIKYGYLIVNHFTLCLFTGVLLTPVVRRVSLTD